MTKAGKQKKRPSPGDKQEPGLDATTLCAGYPRAIQEAGPEAGVAWTLFTTVEGYSPSTQLVYRTTVSKYLRWLEGEGIRLADANPHDVECFLEGENVSASTKVTYRTAIRRFYDVLLDFEVALINPAGEGARQTIQSVQKVPLDRDYGEEPPTLAEMKAAIRDLDPATMDDDPEMLDAGVVLLAGLELGTRDLMPISRFTGVSPWRVAKFARNLRASGVWTDDGMTAGEWHEEEGMVALLMDILVATGMMKRGDAPDPDWDIAEAGMAKIRMGQ